MKKFEVRSLLALIMAATMIFALVACGGGNDTLPPDVSDSEPTVTEPAQTDPVETDPVQTEPVVTEPAVTEPVQTEPPVTEPAVTDPPATTPVETEPAKTEPVETECVHEFGRGVVQIPTCMADGYTEYTCLNCGETKRDSVTAKVDHLYTVEYVTVAGCEADAVQAEKCIYCGDEKSTIVLPASGHSPVTTTVSSVTFTHHSVAVSTCVSCGLIVKSEPVDAHDFRSLQLVPDSATAAGFTNYGFEILGCSGCNFTLTVSANHASGHYYELKETGKYVCTCGDVLVGEMDGKHNGNLNAGPVVFAD